MKIWLINHYAVTPEHPGGTRHYDLAKALNARGHDVTVIASSFHYATFSETRTYDADEVVRDERVDGVRFVWIKTAPYRGNGFGRVRSMLEFAWKLRRLRVIGLPRPDVIVGSTVHLFAVYGAYRLAGTLRVPFVMEVRDIWPRTLVEMGVSRWHPFVLLLSVLEPFLYRRAARIITLLPLAEEHIASFGVPKTKIRWVSNGVDLDRFASVQPSHLLDPAKFNVLYAGTMGIANNLEPLLDAAELLVQTAEIHVTLVGSGPLKTTLVSRVDGLANVTVMDALPKEAVAPLLAEADLLYVGLKDLPLYRFGMSMNKVFDYMAAGRPVVFAAAVPENPVEKAGSGLIVPPDDSAAIANAILTLYNYTPLARSAMAENGCEYVRVHFGMDVIAGQFESVLKEVIDEYETD